MATTPTKEDGGIYALLSTRRLSLSAQFFHQRFFTPYSKMWVQGSWVRSAFWVARTGTGRIVRITYHAASPQSFLLDGKREAGELKVDDVQLSVSGKGLSVRTPEWHTTASATKGAPHNGLMRMNIGVRPMVSTHDGNPVDRWVWPHGLLGQVRLCT